MRNIHWENLTGGEMGAENAYLLRHFILKMISLPRQARDEHEGTLKKEMRFSQATESRRGVMELPLISRRAMTRARFASRI